MRNRRKRPLDERWLEKIFIPDPWGCWEWRGYVSPKGYGEIGVGARGEGTIRAHRYSWERINGPIPDGYIVMHDCDNPPCCNPMHLWLGTPKENTQDMMAKGRDRHGAQKGSARYNSILTEAAVREILSFSRYYGSVEHLAKKFGVVPTAISDVIHGRSWKHVNKIPSSGGITEADAS